MCRGSWVVLFLILLCPFFSSAQEQRIQTRTNDLAADTARIAKLLLEARSLRHKATDSGIALYYQALNQSKTIGYIDGMARSLTGLGLYHMDKGDYNKSLDFYHLARPYCERSTFANGILIANLYNNMAALYGNRGIFDSAVRYYHKSLEEVERRKIRDTTLLLLIYSNLGGRLVSDNQLDQARFYMEKGVVTAEKAGNKPMLAKFYVDLGTLSGAEKKYEQSRLYCYKALSLFSEVQDPASEIAAYCTIGNTYREEKNPKKAITFYQKAFVDSTHSSKTQLAVAYRGLGASYYDLKNYKKAEQYYLIALDIGKQARLNKGMMDCYKALVSVYTDLGDYKTALSYRNSYADLKDSTENSERIKSVNQLEVMYRTSEKDKELTLQQLLLTQRENEIRQKNIYIGAFAGGTILLLALFGSMYRSYKNKERLKVISLEKERELAHLKATMKGEEKERERIARELHDGIMVQFSSVQMNLSALLEKSGMGTSGNFEIIMHQLEEATKELRKSAHNLMPDMLLEEGLAEATHYFCNTLQRSAKIQIDFQLIGQLPALAAEYELMIYRIIQELLQNIVKHARASQALVQINCRPDIISIVVEDNGRGFDRETIKHNGMGLKGIEARVHSLHGHMSMSSEENEGTSVYIELETQHIQLNHSVKDVINKSSYYG